LVEKDPSVHREGDSVLLWHVNYHPDGGQLFWPLDGKPFVVPVALPGDDVKPEDFVAFRSDGSFGIYIHPNIWHEGEKSMLLVNRCDGLKAKVALELLDLTSAVDVSSHLFLTFFLSKRSVSG